MSGVTFNLAMARTSKATCQHFPYKGGAPAVNDTIAGETQVLMSGMLATLFFVQSAKLKSSVCPNAPGCR